MSAQEKFVRFHRDNPHIYRELVAILRLWKSRRGGRWSIWGAYQVARWQRQLVTDSPIPDYKLSNNHTGFYSRLIAHHCPDLADMLELKPGKHVQDFDPSTVEVVPDGND